MQPGGPPPGIPESPSMGVEDVGSISGVVKAMENRVAKKSIGSVERWCGWRNAIWFKFVHYRLSIGTISFYTCKLPAG